VLVVRERELDLGQGPLARGAERIRIQVLPLRAAFNQAMRIVDPSIQVRDGFVGSIIGRPAEPSPLGLFRTQVTLDMSNATLPTVLNEIVKQARGTVWILSQHGRSPEDQYYTLAFRTWGGTLSQFEEKLR